MRYYDIDVLCEFIDYMKEHHGLQHVTFNDDIFTVNKKRVYAICEALKARSISFSCSTRLDCLDDELISVMEDSGCRFICVGIESPSPTVAKIIDKRLNLKRYQKNIDRLKDSSMIINFGFMIGYYGETEETIEETRAFVLKNKLVYTAFFATAFPSTKLYDMVRDRIENEELYLKQLAKVDLSMDYLLNMTNIPRRRLYYLRDQLVADSLINVLAPSLARLGILRRLFMIYLDFMRRFGTKTGFFKSVFEFININVVKPLAAKQKGQR